jgi:hypothetical protein
MGGYWGLVPGDGFPSFRSVSVGQGMLGPFAPARLFHGNSYLQVWISSGMSSRYGKSMEPTLPETGHYLVAIND